MTSRKQNLILSLFIVITMVISIVGFALVSKPPQSSPNTNNPEISYVISRPLSPQEKVSILRSGRAIIEFSYPGDCEKCIDKRMIYENFVTSNEFAGYIVLSYYTSENNETIDWLINLDGTTIDLSDIETKDSLQRLFCEKALLKPEVCILQEI